MILVQYSRFTLFTRFSVICVWTHTFLDFSTLCCFNHLLLSSIILNYISCKHAWNACVIQICTQILHKKHAELFRGLKWFTIKSSIITHYFPFVQSRVFWAAGQWLETPVFPTNLSSACRRQVCTYSTDAQNPMGRPIGWTWSCYRCARLTTVSSSLSCEKEEIISLNKPNV